MVWIWSREREWSHKPPHMVVPNIVHAILASILLSLATARALVSSQTFRQHPLYRCLDTTFSVVLVAILVAVVALRWSHSHPLR